MEKVNYRITLDVHKGGIQKKLSGFFTGDVMSRRIAIGLTAGGVSCKLEGENIAALMYVTKPSGVTNYGECEIVDNTVYYDVIQADTDMEGIVEMQLKVMSSDMVLYAPRFSLEVQMGNSDDVAVTSPQFTALEAAILKANEGKITPKGEWSPDVTYKELDYVTYKDISFVSLKPSIGREPVNGEYWMVSLDGMIDFKLLADGSVPAGDAKQLGGKDAALYASKDDVANVDKKVAEIANNQIPEEYLEAAVDSYVAENSAGFATQASLEAVETDLKSDLSETNDVLNKYVELNQSVNVWDINSAENVSGKFYNSSGNESDGASSSYKHTYNIPVKSGDIVRFLKTRNFTNVTGSPYGVCLDENGTKVEAINGTNIVDDYPEQTDSTTPISYTVPENGAFVVLNYYKSSEDRFMVTINNDYPSEYVSYFEDSYALWDEIKVSAKQIIGSIDDYRWEKTLGSICFIGDSLTRGAYYLWNDTQSKFVNNGTNKNSFPFFFSKETGLEFVNLAKSGSSPSSMWETLSTYDFTPYESFIVWWGTNGGLTDTLDTDVMPYGNYNEFADTNTGCYCKVISKIIEQVPNAKIFLGNVYTASGDANRATTNTVIDKIAELYPNNIIGVVDNYSEGKFWSVGANYNVPSYVHPVSPNGTSNIHFTTMGNYYLARHWLDKINDIIKEDIVSMERLVVIE